MDMKNLEESRAKLHEELAQREQALRETLIRSIHEVEELKRERMERKSRSCKKE